MHLKGMAAPNGACSQAGGHRESSPSSGHNLQSAFGDQCRARRLGSQGVQPSQWLQLSMCLTGMAPPNGACSQAGGTRSLAQLTVAPHVAPEGDGNPQSRGLAGWGDREFGPAGGCSSRCAYGAWQPPMARAHMLVGRGVQPSRWLHLSVRLWGMAAGYGARSRAWGTRSPA